MKSTVLDQLPDMEEMQRVNMILGADILANDAVLCLEAELHDAGFEFDATTAGRSTFHFASGVITGLKLAELRSKPSTEGTGH